MGRSGRSQSHGHHIPRPELQTQDVCQGVSSLSASGFTVGLEVDEMSTEKMMLARRKRAGEGSGITYSPLLSRL